MGFELRNGILYDTGIDESYQDLMTDLMPENMEIQNGILYDTSIDEMYSDIMSEMPTEGFELRNGILYDTGIDQLYNEIIVEVPPVIEQMAEINEINRANGIFPPLYDGFVSNPYYDPGWSAGSFAVMDAVNDMMTMDPVKYTMDSVDTAADLQADFEFNSSMADSYFQDGMSGMSDMYRSRAISAAEELENGDY